MMSNHLTRSLVRRLAEERKARERRPDWRKEWETIKAGFIESTWRRMMREPWVPLYAYYVKTDRIVWGTLYAVSECDQAPAGAELITAERIPADNRAAIARWFERFAGRLEVVPNDR